MKSDRRIVVRGGTLLAPSGPTQSADVAIEDGRIVEVGHRLGRGGHETDASGAFILAGLVDAHTHSSHLVLPAIGDNMPLEEWMLHHVYLAPTLTAEEAYLAAVVTAGRLLRTGTVALLDHGPPLGPENWSDVLDATVSAYLDVGIRCAVAPILADQYLWETLSGSEGARVREAVAQAPLSPLRDHRSLLARARAFLDRWHAKHPGVRCLLGPSAPERASAELLSGLVAIARERGVGFHLHLFESRVQRRAEGASSVVELLEQLGMLGRRSSLAHCVWITDREIDRIARSGTVVVHNPVSNLRVGTGVAPLRSFQARGVHVALGSDGALADESLDMFQVMKLAALIHKVTGPLIDAPTAASVLGMCQRGGAKALDLGEVGLQPGDRGDLVVIEGEDVATGSVDQVLNQIVYGGARRAMRTVLVGGRPVVEDGEPTLQGWRDFERRAMARRSQRAGTTSLGSSTGLGAALRELAEAAHERSWPDASPLAEPEVPGGG